MHEKVTKQFSGILHRTGSFYGNSAALTGATARRSTDCFEVPQPMTSRLLSDGVR